MQSLGQGLGEIIGAFIGGFVTAFLYAGCVIWGSWKILKLKEQPEKQTAEYFLPTLFIVLGILGLIW